MLFDKVSEKFLKPEGKTLTVIITNKLKLELNLYRPDFEVLTNYSCLNRILRSIFLVFLATILVIVIPMSKSLAIFMMLTIIFGGMLITDRFLRKLYSDWPHSKNFIGTIIFADNYIETLEKGQIKHLPLSNCSELLIFSDHYAGYNINHRDYQRNGNALIFYKNTDGETKALKFNINTEKEYNNFFKIKELYRDNVKYYKEYGTTELYHILKSDLSDRIEYP